jgi:hypothetical protein
MRLGAVTKTEQPWQEKIDLEFNRIVTEATVESAGIVSNGYILTLDQGQAK